MYIDYFKVFCDLVQSGSFSKAASMNGITQSAVSQQVRSIESRYDCVLVDRGRRNLSLTPEGKAFHSVCEKIVAVWSDYEARIKELKNVIAGEIVVASIYSIGLHELPPRLKKFQENYPDVRVKVEYRRSPQVYEMVEDGEAHIGLVAYPTKRATLLFEVFDEDQMVIICSPKHALARKKKAPLTALEGERFISFEPDTPTRKVLDRQLRDAGVHVIVATEFDNVETVKRAVEIESGVSIVPANTVTEEVKSGQLCAINVEPPTVSRPLGLLLSRTHTRPSGLKELIAALKAGK